MHCHCYPPHLTDRLQEHIIGSRSADVGASVVLSESPWPNILPNYTSHPMHCCHVHLLLLIVCLFHPLLQVPTRCIHFTTKSRNRHLPLVEISTEAAGRSPPIRSILDPGSIKKSVSHCYTISMWYLVTDGHICPADIVLMTQICAFAPVHKCQNMKTFHCVSGQPPMV